MRRARRTIAGGVALLLIGACATGDSDTDTASRPPADGLPALSSQSDAGAGGVAAVSEISDFLPTVERQIGVDGPIERFASIPESDDLFLRGTIERVEPWFAIAGELVRSEDGRTITDSGERRIADYADPDALWQFSKVHVRIADDFGEPDFDADRITARMRFPIEDVEPYVGTDSLIFASTPYFDPPWQRRDDVEWTASGIVPIRADGTIAWHEQQQDVVGRATTIGALESIAERGEIVVTEGRANPPVVIERTARTDR